MSVKGHIKGAIYFLKCIFILPGVDWTDKKFLKDLKRWKEIRRIESSDCVAFSKLMWELPEFRNLFIYRNNHRLVFRTWVKFLYRPMNTLFIETKEIGGGLYIQHGFSTMIAAESIGENCWINQQVTIGYKGNGRPPIIGDGVTITCGAKVLGSINVGNRAIIGANAVVIRDVEDGAVMGGIPARKIK